MKKFVLQVVLLNVFSVFTLSFADSDIHVQVGNIKQLSTGTHIVSEINIGSSVSERTGGLSLNVDVGDVAAKASGSGNRSSINIGSVKGEDTSGFTTRVVIGGKVILDTKNSSGQINIGSQLSN